MKIGSHNTMSFLSPKHFWLRPFRFMARCQRRHFIDQYYAADARMFDMRFVFDKQGRPEFAHGIMTFKTPASSMNNLFTWLNDKAEDEEIWVRIINERNKDYDKFIQFCKELKIAYKHIKFFGGINKKDWRQLYDFGYGEPKFIDKYSSNNYDHFGTMTGWHWDDFWPWLYAKLHNEKWREAYKEYDGYLMQDFI